jgi:hypothetical protein
MGFDGPELGMHPKRCTKDACYTTHLSRAHLTTTSLTFASVGSPVTGSGLWSLRPSREPSRKQCFPDVLVACACSRGRRDAFWPTCVEGLAILNVPYTSAGKRHVVGWAVGCVASDAAVNGLVPTYENAAH